jgi:pimeloyl-ACP methyl ester carboxylesterase
VVDQPLVHHPPMTSQALSIDGIDIHIDGEGDDTIVMIHGWPDTWRLWDAQVEALKSRWRCVRFTLPGFDVTQARRAYSLAELVAFFEQVVRAVSPGRPVSLMLHDWGAVFGYQFAMAHPSLVTRIVGVDIGDTGSSEYLRSLRLPAKLGIFAYQAWLAIAWRIGGALGDRMTRGMARALKVPSDLRDVGSCMNYPYDIQWTGSHGSYKHLAAVEPSCPMLFIYGRRKPFLFHSPEWAQRLAGRPGNRVVPMEARHWVMRDQPDAFNTAVIDWLSQR